MLIVKMLIDKLLIVALLKCTAMEECLDATDATYRNYTNHREEPLSVCQLKGLDKMIQHYYHMITDPTSNSNNLSTTIEHI